MKVGDTVYTVNAKTNSIDDWIYTNQFRTPNGILIHLRHNKQYCFLPLKCVYETREKALEVVNMK